MSTDPQLFAVADQFHRAGAFAQAQRLYRQLLEHNAENAELWRRLGEACQALGDRRDAEAAYRESLRRTPHADTANNLGVVLLAPGRLEDAAAAFREALRLRPDFAEAHNNLGLALAELGRPQEAAGHYRQAVRLKPDYTLAHLNLGKALASLGNPREAEEHFREAARLWPGCAQAHFHLGNLLRAQARRDEAVDAYRAGLKADPADHRMHNELGITLLDRARAAEAAACFQEAVRLKPDYAPAYNNLGLALLELGRSEEARVRLGQSLFLNPEAVEAQYNLGRILTEQGLHDEALALFERAVQAKPDAVGALNNLGNAYKDQGRLDEAVARYRQALALDPRNATVHSNLLFARLYQPGPDPDEVFAEHVEYGRRHAPPAPAAAPPREPLSGRRLRVGYVSPDFRAHVLGSYSELVLAAHDRGRFETFCYSDVRRPDAATERIRGRAEHWRPLAGLSDAEAADLVRRDRIDVLIDLAGHTGSNRLPLFALRPAPLQATHYGYAATTGLGAMDYRITDADHDPPGRTERWHVEELVRLPETWWCYKGGPPLELGPPPSARAGHVTFGSFNNLSKASDEALALWARVLRALPGSRLQVLAGAGAAGDRRVLDLLGRGGVDAGRVTLLGRRPTEAYFRLFAGVDVCLDPFPFTGCNTTADALWMGVPVVTLAGDRCAGRQSLGLLRRTGLDDLVAETADGYVDAAVRVAGDALRLSELRGALRERLRQSAWMDAARFTRNLEAAYLAMWEKGPRQTAPAEPRGAGAGSHPVHSLWCGPSPLGPQQLLAVRSFQAHGHPFVLWTYTPDLKVPDGVLLRDARDILPASAVYRLRGGTHPGSLAFFSDYFQLALLLRQGGWWVQMDVQCLKPLDALAEPYVFAPHYDAGVSAYAMKAPADGPALRWMFERHPQVCKPDAYNWHDSMRLMGEGVRRFGLGRYVAPRDLLDDDGSHADNRLFRPGGGPPPASRFVHHWCDSISAARAATPAVGSFYHESLLRYQLR